MGNRCLQMGVALASVLAVGLARADGGSVDIGKKVTLASRILGEDRELLVYLPPGYADSQTRYPVLVLLDGQENFHHGSGVVDLLSTGGVIPGVIVVGVVNTDRGRDMSPVKIDVIANSGGADRFLRFLREELLPFVDARYRTVPFRLVFGHCLAGTFVLHTLLHQPEAFQVYLASSPWVDFDQVTFHDGAKKRLSALKIADRMLYVSVGDERDFVPGFERLSAMLQDVAPKTLRWEAQKLAEKSHEAVVLQGLYHGLEAVFAGWQLPEEVRVQGLAAIQDHYRALAKRFGLETRLPPEMLNNTAFEFIQKKNFPEATKLLLHCTTHYPEFWICYHNLAFSYQQTGDTKLAIQNYEKTLQLHPDNQKARERLKKLKTGK